MHSTIELSDLIIKTDIGTYGSSDVKPKAHFLDLSLTIDPGLVLIAEDGMDHVFDYDPLIVEIDRLARDGHYHTQERLITRIVEACSAYAEIAAVALHLRKSPVLNGSGVLGVQLSLSAEDLNSIRQDHSRKTQ